ncbi:hypothetical protein VD0002_g5010 [Verticillium dahliae]|uniref:Uncharacterized protein n=1 Tax=Verticillium dahliae TaxID=27337 RepID=A0AA44W8P8_VERDA|nr:hypothetical protein BJF96_g9776 [Verticillium dahliae]PNH50593.1 hypothetical protein VD0003_g6590 [Verticillium dahliae]PNH63306.1 hypothetical protein VD0002_g5010 [Verticillium dahliae]
MASLGLTILYIGINLKRFDESGSVSDDTTSMGNKTPAYLALGLATKESRHAITKHRGGFPKRSLFFDCLNP